METIDDNSSNLIWLKTARVVYVTLMLIALGLILFVFQSGLAYYLDFWPSFYFTILGSSLLINILAHCFSSNRKTAKIRILLNSIILLTNLIHFGIFIVVIGSNAFYDETSLLALLYLLYTILSGFEFYRSIQEKRSLNNGKTDENGNLIPENNPINYTISKAKRLTLIFSYWIFTTFTILLTGYITLRGYFLWYTTAMIGIVIILLIISLIFYFLSFNKFRKNKDATGFVLFSISLIPHLIIVFQLIKEIKNGFHWDFG